jgi:hypothetical protein
MFIHAGGGPDLAVGKDRVHVKVTLEGFVAEYVGEVDLRSIYGRRCNQQIGNDDEQCDFEFFHLEDPFSLAVLKS